jgi:hypothetical protein
MDLVGPIKRLRQVCVNCSYMGTAEQTVHQAM